MDEVKAPSPTERAAGNAEFVADLRALLDLYEANPDLPGPYSRLHITASVPLATFQRIAAEHGHVIPEPAIMRRPDLSAFAQLGIPLSHVLVSLNSFVPGPSFRADVEAAVMADEQAQAERALADGEDERTDMARELAPPRRGRRA